MLLAAGAGTRVGHAVNKVFLPLAGRPVLAWSLDSTAGLSGLVETVVVLQDHDRRHADAVALEAPARALTLVRGGDTRHDSELAALRHLAPRIDSGGIDVVALHDAARPLAAPTLFDRVVDQARRIGGALPVLDQAGLVMDDGRAPGTRLVTVQTPQAFRAAPLLAAYERSAAEGFTGSDTAACIERFSDLQVVGVPGDATNIKITFAHDLTLAERLLARAGQHGVNRAR